MSKVKTKTNESKDIETKLNSLEGKSSKIRYLNSIGWSRKEISTKLNIRYQHVRNVLVTVLKKDNYKAAISN
jgi:DNA-binding NarL/FixJ family response regulator